MRDRFLFFLFLAGSQVLWSQADSNTFQRLQLGLVGGQTFHEVDFTPNTTTRTLTGNTYGVALRYFDKQLIGFQAELSYDAAGWQEVLGESSVYERRIEYAELQILTQLSIGRGAVQPLLQAGPYLSVPLSDEETLPADYSPEAYPVNAYYGRELPFRLNYGLRAGLGLNVELGPLTLQLEGRYLQGFSNLVKPGESQASTSIRRAYGGHLGLFYAI